MKFLIKIYEAIMSGKDRKIPLEDSMYMSMMYDLQDHEDDPSIDSVISEYDADKEEGKKTKEWSLIPATEYANALKRFIKQGKEFYNFPEKKLRGWLRLCFKNLMELEVFTQLAGHTPYGPDDEIYEHYGVEDESEFDMEKFIDEFFEWAVLPDGSDAYSDYGIKPIVEIFQDLDENASSSEMIVALNRILDVIHQRGDLASMFIEGGSKTLSKISNDRSL